MRSIIFIWNTIFLTLLFKECRHVIKKDYEQYVLLLYGQERGFLRDKGRNRLKSLEKRRDFRQKLKAVRYLFSFEKGGVK